MIRKFFICGKQLYLQSKNLESYNDLGTVIELLLPIDEYWELEKEVKEVNYLVAAGENTAEVTSAYREALQRAARHAVKEKERVWLYEKSKP